MSKALSNNIVDIYEKHCQAFSEQRSVALYEKTWLDRFLNLIPAGGHILDIGCGNGMPIADYFLQQGFQVTGVDSSASMISRCRKQYSHQRWIQADMRELALAEKFDGVIAWDSFFHLTQEDQQLMFAIFRQHAKAGAPVMFTSGPDAGEAIGNFEGEALFHASLAPQTYRALLAAEGFDVKKMIANDPACTGHTVWLAQSD